MSFPTTPTNGQIATLNGITYVYNSTNLAWTRQTASANVALAQGNSAIIINNQTITADAYIGPGQNGFSVGPVTTAAGVKFSIAAGQRWVII